MSDTPLLNSSTQASRFDEMVPTLERLGFRCRILDNPAGPAALAAERIENPALLTVLLYFNTSWTQPGGRLRVLRSATDMEDYAAEVPPVNGILFAFRRSDHSWHGFPPCTGERRSLQLQYVKPKRVERGFQHKTSLTKRVRRVLRGFGF